MTYNKIGIQHNDTHHDNAQKNGISIVTFGIVTFCIMTFNLMAFSIMTLVNNDTQHNGVQHNNNNATLLIMSFNAESVVMTTVIYAMSQ
jgi:hypothetical protein